MRTTRWVLFILLVSLVGSGLLKAGAPPEGQPILTPAPDVPTPPHEPDSSVLQEQVVRANLDVARDPQAKKLRLPLFAGSAPLDLVLTSRRVNRDGSVIWSGKVMGQPASSVVLSVGNEVLIADIATQPTKEEAAKYYEIRYLGHQLHVLRQIDPTVLASEANPAPPVLDIKGGGSATAKPVETCTSDPPGTIDALVVYTPRAREKANGTAAMEQAINVYIQQTNDSYAQSGITQRIRLVHVEEVKYQESPSGPESDRDSLKAPGGKLAEVHVMRDKYGADIVALIVEYTKAETDNFGCGYAYVMKTVGNAFESSAFAAIPRICADRSYSLTHEFGHLMGARHDWYVAQSESDPNEPFPSSHGYVHLPTVTPGPAFRTVMAKKDACGKRPCDRVLFWSNPAIPYPPSGAPMGDASSINATTLNETASTVANFRCSQP